MSNEDELRKLAEQGNAKSQFLLGSMYIDKNNESDGIYWLKKSANQGYGHAQDCLSMCYSYGIVVAKSNFHANYWGKKAEENENRGTYVPNLLQQPKCVQNRLYELQRQGKL